jgi:hypothetical protein
MLPLAAVQKVPQFRPAQMSEEQTFRFDQRAFRTASTLCGFSSAERSPG